MAGFIPASPSSPFGPPCLITTTEQSQKLSLGLPGQPGVSVGAQSVFSSAGSANDSPERLNGGYSNGNTVSSSTSSPSGSSINISGISNGGAYHYWSNPPSPISTSPTSSLLPPPAAWANSTKLASRGDVLPDSMTANLLDYGLTDAADAEYTEGADCNGDGYGDDKALHPRSPAGRQCKVGRQARRLPSPLCPSEDSEEVDGLLSGLPPSCYVLCTRWGAWKYWVTASIRCTVF
ncbi:unnamed protein product [Protopolystoma xenopodis]|uniref:Uncharacterized protein n=1 Tax=Protopolystoma xenopodis TaxID=117903 RepID=A0A3S5C7D4_9PLAT|nr:unnamed protein product [Protopolystoma xenopodis]